MKNLIPIIWKVAETLLNEADPYEKLILGALAGSAGMEECMEKSKGSWSMSPALGATFSKACSALNLSLSQLGLVTHREGLPLWHYTIKNHILEHIVQEACELSPMHTWNYACESLLMHIRAIIAGNRSQPNIWSLQAVAMKGWLGGFELGHCPRRV